MDENETYDAYMWRIAEEYNAYMKSLDPETTAQLSVEDDSEEIAARLRRTETVGDCFFR